MKKKCIHFGISKENFEELNPMRISFPVFLILCFPFHVFQNQVSYLDNSFTTLHGAMKRFTFDLASCTWIIKSENCGRIHPQFTQIYLQEEHHLAFAWTPRRLDRGLKLLLLGNLLIWIFLRSTSPFGYCYALHEGLGVLIEV